MGAEKKIQGELKNPQTITHTIDIQGFWLQSTGQISQAGEWEARESPLVQGREESGQLRPPHGVYGFMSVGVIKNVVISSLQPPRVCLVLIEEINNLP